MDSHTHTHVHRHLIFQRNVLSSAGVPPRPPRIPLLTCTLRSHPFFMKVVILFSAHSVPMKVVNKGDHYVPEVSTLYKWRSSCTVSISTGEGKKKWRCSLVALPHTHTHKQRTSSRLPFFNVSLWHPGGWISESRHGSTANEMDERRQAGSSAHSCMAV